jgi:CO dehydrogenase/acetyl-CoA synthase gamma subunit (corrinoid Fe-S protein)
MLLRNYTLEIFNSECMVFATQVAEGAKGLEDCPPIGEENSKKLSEYMSRFRIDY